jgi:aspartyl/asparaginyl-tRNA synthetase
MDLRRVTFPNTGADEGGIVAAPHGGFALGLERWTARLIDAHNIRETTLFARDLNRLSP